MTSATNKNNIAEEFLDMEIARIRHLDGLLVNDVERIRREHNMLYTPLIIFLSLLFVLAGLIQGFDSNNSGLFIFLLFILLLIVIPTKIRIYKNLKLFNESKAKLERAGLRLWRRKERNLINPVKNLIEVASNNLDAENRFTLIPLQDIDLNNYKQHLWDI